jgi:two-component system, chemotaxis family, chemotaxis protein CheY
MACLLVVDDVDVVRMGIGMILRRAGHTVDEASDGAEALNFVKIRQPQAVITDIWMPNMDGLDLIRALRSKYPGVAVVAISGGSRQYSEESSLDRARSAGATQMLMKPFSGHDLLLAIDKSIEARRAASAVPDIAS